MNCPAFAKASFSLINRSKSKAEESDIYERKLDRCREDRLARFFGRWDANESHWNAIRATGLRAIRRFGRPTDSTSRTDPSFPSVVIRFAFSLSLSLSLFVFQSFRAGLFRNGPLSHATNFTLRGTRPAFLFLWGLTGKPRRAIQAILVSYPRCQPSSVLRCVSRIHLISHLGR